MPRFHYRALRLSGGEVAGELVATDERDVTAQLQAQGSYPIEIAAAVRGSFLARPLAARSRRIAARDLVLFTRQLATLVTAGIALDRALGLAGGGGRRAVGRLARELLIEVNRGESFSRACARQSSLPRHYAMFIAAGEARGSIAAALDRLAQVLERSRSTARALLDALIYPASVMVVACASISFLLGFVVPRFEGLMTSLQHEPPVAMRLLLALSSTFQQVALPAALVGAIVMSFLIVRHTDPAFRLALHRRLLAAPWLGPLVTKLEAERLFHLLGNLVAAGVQLPAALAAARSAMTSEAFRAGLALSEQGVERGDGIAAALAASGVLPEVAVELVRVGEESGELAPMLLNAGEVLRRDFEAASTELIGLVTPVSILLLGLLVGAVAAAILGTVMQIYDFAG